MDETSNKHWPKTPEGVTDWERVFEDPDTGLIAIACRPGTPEELKSTVIVIIKKLYKRQNDQAVAGKLITYVDKVIPDGAPIGAMDTLRANAAKVMRRIKEDRVRRATAYAEAMKAKAGGGASGQRADRRSGTTTGLGRERFFGRHGVMAAGIVLMGLIGSVLAYVSFDSASDKEASNARAIAWSRDAVTEQLPNDKWKVTAATIGKEGEIKVDVLVGDPWHVKTIMGFNAITRPQFVSEVCPSKDSGVMTLIEDGWRIWITLISRTDILTGKTCRY